ncbi:MAG TPA: glycosyltransferase [bacterium]|nr:glycosyltransferase [bacterium]
MNTDQPLISIVIPVYNGENYLREAIDSALAQTYPNIEVIVVNDGSTDDGATERIALSYGDRIRYFAKKNGGVASALNMALREMRGEYFSWLSHDDVYLPEKIVRQWEVLSRSEGKRMVTCHVCVIDSSGKKLREIVPSSRLSRSPRWFLALDIDGGMNGCSLLIPKSAFDEYGDFDENLQTTQDYDMWFRITNNYSIAIVPEVLLCSRQHAKQGAALHPQLCTKEGDTLHARFVESLGTEGFADYINGDIKYLARVHDAYFSAGYRKTAVAILRMAMVSLTEEYDLFLTDLSRSAIDFVEPSPHITAKGIRDFLLQGKEKKRLLFYSYAWTIGGVQRVLATLLPLLSEHYGIVLVCPEKQGGQDAFPVPSGVLQITLPVGSPEILGQRLVTLVSLLSADVFIGCPNTDETFLPVYTVLKDSNIKTIMWNHYNYFLPFQYDWLHSVVRKRSDAFKIVDVIVWPTVFSANITSLLYGKSISIPNPLPFPAINKERIEKKKNILCIGRFDDALKRIDLAFRVFHLILQKHPDAKLIVVGKYDGNVQVPLGSGRKIDNVFKDYNFPPGSVVFQGEQPSVEEFYRPAKVFLQTSETEGFGMTLIESAAFGVPAVAFDLPGLDEIISDGENGFLVPMGDCEAMADRINCLFEKETLCSSFAEKAMTSSQRFGEERILKAWKCLLTSFFACSISDLSCEWRARSSLSCSEADAFLRRMVFCYEKSCVDLLMESERSKSLLSSRKKRFSFFLNRDLLKRAWAHLKGWAF